MGDLSDTGGVSPLDVPGGRKFKQEKQEQESEGVAFKPGDVVQTISPNSAIFNSYPKSGAVPSGLLAQGVSLMILEVDKDFLKVSTEQGATGYVSQLVVQPVSMLPADGQSAPEPEIPSFLNAAEEDAELAPSPESIAPPIPEDPTQGGGVAPEPEIPGLQEKGKKNDEVGQ